MLDTIDLSKSLTREDYQRDLVRYQVALGALGYQVYAQQRPVVIVFEGWDAAGKGGAIKRATERLDPRGYVVYPIGAPQGEDKTHHYLWRFWRRLPERGQIAIFDRSWYGRVMVERIEGFCSEREWKRAYREINHFERQLADFGTSLFKFWIHISVAEQMRRFSAREQTPYKAWKLTDEDWRNRERWDRYEEAVNEMLLKTSTLTAPWTVVEGNSKWYARIRVLRKLVDGLSQELAYDPFAQTARVSKKANKGDARTNKPGQGPSRELPMIDQFEYGSIVLDGETYRSNVFIYPDGSIERWRPGGDNRLRRKDAARMVEAEPETVVIGLGTAGRMTVTPAAQRSFEEAGIEPLTYRTHKACDTYRELRRRRRLGAILHITS